MTSVLGIAVWVGVALVVFWAWQAARRRARIRQRLRRLDRIIDFEDVDEATLTLRADDGSENRLALLVFLDRTFPLAGGVRAGLSAVIGAVVVGMAAAAALVFFGLAMPFAIGGGLVLGALVGWNVGNYLDGRQRTKYADRLSHAVDEFQRMVRFGMPTAEAFRAMTAGTEEPLGASLRRVRDNTALGMPLAVALDREAQRVRVSELAMLGAIFATQARGGGGLAESVGNLADMLRERKDNRARVKVATAESKLSLYVLSAVPFVAVAIQGASKPEIFDLLLGDARHLLGIGAGLILLGLATAWMLVRRMQR